MQYVTCVQALDTVLLDQFDKAINGSGVKAGIGRLVHQPCSHLMRKERREREEEGEERGREKKQEGEKRKRERMRKREIMKNEKLKERKNEN